MNRCIVHNCFISVLHHAGPPLLCISITIGQPLTHNLCRKLPKSKRKTDNEQSPAFPTHPIPPTQPLGQAYSVLLCLTGLYPCGSQSLKQELALSTQYRPAFNLCPGDEAPGRLLLL